MPDDDYIRVPVRTTSAVEEPLLRNRNGHLLIGHECTDMQQSFIIELPGEEDLLQLGIWEFDVLEEEPDDG